MLLGNFTIQNNVIKEVRIGRVRRSNVISQGRMFINKSDQHNVQPRFKRKIKVTLSKKG